MSQDNFTSAYRRTHNGGRKFIGGAAAARLNAKKRAKATRILRPDEVLRSRETLPASLNAFERFFAGILRSEPAEYTRGEDKEVWRVMCKRLGLPVPAEPLPDSYDRPRDHFANRASLVIEESRQAVADGLSLLAKHYRGRGQRQRRKGGNKPDDVSSWQTLVSMQLVLSGMEHKKSGHSILTYHKENGAFTRDEMLSLRHGTVMACLNEELSPTIENAVLGTVVPQSRDEMIESHSFSVMVFKLMKKTVDEKWNLTAITSLLSEQRRLEACTTQMSTPVPFLFHLLGGKKSTHFRFHEDDDGMTHAVKAEDRTSHDHDMPEIIDLDSTFCLPRLNTMQDEAANSFLASKDETITLVQGPPGTGKTTLLTSVICRYIMESQNLEHVKRCLMVCAPTNKAITVLCSRFLDSFVDESFPCNAVLIGDDDKLLEDERESTRNGRGSPSKLRSIFLYTYIDTVESDYLYTKRTLMRWDQKSKPVLQRLLKIARRLKNRLDRTISDPQVLERASRIVTLLGDLLSPERGIRRVELLDALDFVLHAIAGWKRESIWQEILQNADVIFCTLASAGASILKKAVNDVDDLIVDEAAAATEPEMYIPFQYRPKRLLAVGDPKQLPATITSRIAQELGLSKSLHERLMYGCGHDHIMLDTQYRMSPALSQFPSKHFYEGKLINASNVVSVKYSNSYKILGAPVYTVYQINGKERHGRSGSMENEMEARAVVQIVECMKRESEKCSRNWCSSDRLRIITFYQAQVALIKRFLRQRNLGDVLVATVDSSQGCEADFVIVSFVRSEGQSGRNSVGFLTDERRLNVSITRAKYQIVCVGNIHRMSELPDGRADTVKNLALDAIEREAVFSFPLNGLPSSMHGIELINGNIKAEPVESTAPPMDNVPTRKRRIDANVDSREQKPNARRPRSIEMFTAKKDDGYLERKKRTISRSGSSSSQQSSSDSSGSSSISGDSSDSDSSGSDESCTVASRDKSTTSDSSHGKVVEELMPLDPPATDTSRMLELEDPVDANQSDSKARPDAPGNHMSGEPPCVHAGN